MSKKTNTTNGITLSALVFLVFLTLKLGGLGTVAGWSWWWVFAPLWVPFFLVVIIIVIGFIGWVIREALKR